jgi:hypothetical protein
MFNTSSTFLHCVLVFTETMHLCNLIMVHMYSMHSDLPLNPGVTKWYQSRVDYRTLA